jgi:hypothetical protein
MVRSWAFALLAASVLLLQASEPSTVLAGSRTAALKSGGVGTDYASALATADRFLQAWQAGDAENGMALLTGHARQKVSREDMETFFSESAPVAYEITRGREIQRGRYEFPVMLLSSSSSPPAPQNSRVHRRFSNIVVLKTGNGD